LSDEDVVGVGPVAQDQTAVVGPEVSAAADGILPHEEAEPEGSAVAADEAAGAEVDVVVGVVSGGLDRSPAGQECGGGEAGGVDDLGGLVVAAEGVVVARLGPPALALELGSGGVVEGFVVGGDSGAELGGCEGGGGVVDVGGDGS